MREALEPIVIQGLAGLGYDLVEFQVRGTRSRPVVEVRIDREDGSRVTVDDCARVSRALEAQFDALPSLSGTRYVLEVSSPGLDRPLKRAADWRRFAGRRASLKSAALGGRVEVEILGVDGPEGAEVVAVRVAPGDDRRVALADIAEARLAVRWS